ncbi:amidohydrolase family protein [Rhizobium anhuiense]|jgi:predicted TIM-barrel fold metal-dependent hydrolase|uniref:amidohydrolase family protein n=1 Tax=Rhizobium anhuiense TaxID=1184720 RepID=UPI000BE9C378|nr:amidohydrolase family protein [Rhizobium anhuiense]UTS87701.1 amidohydrolase [Rhizobium anhuiense bv. trifolii]
MDRREFLRFGAVAATGIVTGCGRDGLPLPPPTGGVKSELIDAHCHLFNGADLPMVRFVSQVVLKAYPEQSRPRITDVENPSLLDHFVELFLRVAGSGSAPTARQEIDYLDGKTPGTNFPRSEDAAKARGRRATETYLNELVQRVGGPVLMGAAPEQLRRQNIDRAFLTELMKSSRVVFPADTMPSPRQTRQVSFDLFSGLSKTARYLNWFSLFRLYRHVLADMLDRDTQAQGFKPVLFTPAIIDYDRWLGENVVRSPLQDQMQVMDRVSRRKTGPAVHGYFGYDPLREVYFRRGKKPENALGMARKALLDHGFIGIKLYPPMGFRPLKNERPYHQRNLDDLKISEAQLSAELDSALIAIYDLCVELDAPILAHAAASNASGSNEFARRADPYYWLPVFERYRERNLRVCLAHFGGFETLSAAATSTRMPQASWEWVLGPQFKEHPDQPVFADLSYFSEIVNGKSDAKDRIAPAFKEFVETFDPQVKHLVFGTDWIMLGQEPGYKTYVSQVDRFLRDECRLDEEERHRFFIGNASRFLPLSPGTIGRDRLLSFYKRHNLDSKRLPLPPAENALARWLRT